MNEWKNAKVDASARKAFELATNIASRFGDEKVRSAYILFAAMNIPEAGIYKTLGDMGMQLLPRIDEILEDKELFASIFGERAAEKVFETQDGQKVGGNEQENEPDEFAAKVIDVLSDIMGWEGDSEGYLEIMVPEYSDKLEFACQDAYIRCKLMQLDYISLDVIVYCILQNNETSAYRFISNLMNALGVDMDILLQSLKVTANIVDDISDENIPIIIPAALENCLENLNARFVKGQEPKILGRDKEKYKAFNVFSKKTKRNCVLVGYPGVGKTAIMEAITQDIVNEVCPKEFIGYTVLSLDINAMLAGTKYRGEFETKIVFLKQFLETTKKIILFVDEMHQMLGAGSSSEGNGDLSGSLKPILARDDVVFVGATTVDEYDRILSRDGAFKRRFEVVMVEEPKTDKLKPMIKAQIKSMEKHHGVKMSEDILDYIILCSSCFSSETCNPDKTLDLCDRSMAITKMAGKKIVTKTHVNKVYEECFEKYDKIDDFTKINTAYHEVGHYITTRLTEEHKAHKVVAISIIPTTDFLGVNILESTDAVVSWDMHFIETYLMSLLAGRVAQFKHSGRIDSGASNDLQHAKRIARQVITKYGMDNGAYENICILDDDVISEHMANQINDKVNALIRKVYEQTSEFVNNHWGEIMYMARYLLEKKIVTSDELDQFLAK